MKNRPKNNFFIEYWCHYRILRKKIHCWANFELHRSLISKAAEVFRKSTIITKNLTCHSILPNEPIFSLNHLHLSCNRAKIGISEIIYACWKISILVKRLYYRPFFSNFRVKFKRKTHFLFQIRNLHWISNRIGT